MQGRNQASNRKIGLLLSTLLEKIKEGQETILKMEPNSKKEISFRKSEKRIILFKDMICVPNNENLKKEILPKIHTTPYSLHPGTTKMYRDLKKHYWWPEMKKDIVKFMAQCFTCQ